MSASNGDTDDKFNLSLCDFNDMARDREVDDDDDDDNDDSIDDDVVDDGDDFARRFMVVAAAFLDFGRDA